MAQQAELAKLDAGQILAPKWPNWVDLLRRLGCDTYLRIPVRSSNLPQPDFFDFQTLSPSFVSDMPHVCRAVLPWGAVPRAPTSACRWSLWNRVRGHLGVVLPQRAWIPPQWSPSSVLRYATPQHDLSN